MKQARWLLHPIFVFVLSTVALAISLFLYIYWYIGVSAELKAVIAQYHLDASQFFEARTWLVILILSLLVGIILAGILIIFLYHLKTIQLYRLQQNFINNFTHELKTPVTSLKLYLETFLRYPLPREKQGRYIGFMLQDVERLSGNINSILNLARIESKVWEGEYTVIDPAEEIRRFVSENRRLFDGCDIQVAPPGDRLPAYPVIVPLFETLLINLLANARKYNTSAHPRIEISFAIVPGALQIRFCDNGIGLEKDERKKIFRKFAQGRRDEQVSAGGSGIGLYLVQQIARLHGGKVLAESDGPGKGSVFVLALPLPPKKGTKP